MINSQLAHDSAPWPDANDQVVCLQQNKRRTIIPPPPSRMLQ
jgi:hypothetical protein